MIITSGGLFYEEKTDYRKTKLKQLKSFSQKLCKSFKWNKKLRPLKHKSRNEILKTMSDQKRMKKKKLNT